MAHSRLCVAEHSEKASRQNGAPRLVRPASNYQRCAMARQEIVTELDGHPIRLSRLDKVFYPQTGFTKGQMIDYYVQIAPVLLPHLQARPLTLKRYPEGVKGMFFYEKNCPAYRPSWMKTAQVWSEGNQRYMFYCVVEDVASLVWLANLADIELHTSLACAPEMDRPTIIAFDLDPDRVVSEMKKSQRAGKVFVDWSQNDTHKTTVCVYSLRAKERPTVSTPVTWNEVENCLQKEDPE